MRAKSNIGPDEGGFLYQLEQNDLVSHLGVCGSFIKWKKFVEGSSRDWLATAEKTNEGKRPSALQRAIEFLSELLADGPLTQQYIEEQYSKEIRSPQLDEQRLLYRLNHTKKEGLWVIKSRNGYGHYQLP